MKNKANNKKGFTLVELIATISIMAFVAAMVTPNIIKSVNNSKKNQILGDAKTLIAEVKSKSKLLKYKSNFPTASGNCKTLSFSDLDISVPLDPDKKAYTTSSIKICMNNDNETFNYSINLESIGWATLNNNFVKEDNLNLDSIIKK